MKEKKRATNSSASAASSPSTQTAQPSAPPRSYASTPPSSPNSSPEPSTTAATPPTPDPSWSASPTSDQITFTFNGTRVDASLNNEPLDLLHFNLHWTRPYTPDLSAIVARAADDAQ